MHRIFSGKIMNIRRLGFLAASILCASFISAQDTHADKTGILLVHYGTQNDNSRAATIDRLNKRVAEQYADCAVLEAYAAPSVIRMLDKRGIHKLSIPQALDSLKALGCNRLAVQSTMLLDGVMTDMLRREVEAKKCDFKTVSVARPLLYNADDCRRMAMMIRKNLEAGNWLKSNPQVVLVGHGSDSPANAMYCQLDYVLQDEGFQNWHVGTIEGYPTIENVERQLKKQKNKNVVLVPLLYIAGNHQREDIDGKWKEQLEKDGYKVSVVDKGLGEMEEIQSMIIDGIERMKN